MPKGINTRIFYEYNVIFEKGVDKIENENR